ncbi:hypothetical protein K440DRAFT_620143 [Wilcoxina mikolae CBS 423.85]|nr:hypothetical protein K440DRAFT_620143 [Wilcoxina mikolae CBS 423.85]
MGSAEKVHSACKCTWHRKCIWLVSALGPPKRTWISQVHLALQAHLALVSALGSRGRTIITEVISRSLSIISSQPKASPA